MARAWGVTVPMTSLRTKTRAGYVWSAPGSALLGALALETTGLTGAIGAISAFSTALEVAAATGLWPEFAARAEVALSAVGITGVTPASALALETTGLTGAIGAISAFSTALEVAAATGLWPEFAARAEVALSAVGITGVTPASALALETTGLTGAIGAISPWRSLALRVRPCRCFFHNHSKSDKPTERSGAINAPCRKTGLFPRRAN